MNERNADVSKTLTDKWKKGELPSGWYYVKGNRAEGIYAYTAEYLNNMYRPRNSERIVEQVPSYEEWQAKLEENTKLKEQIYKFAESNQSLRKKLDEEKAKNRIDYYTGSPMDYLDECERDRKKNKIYKNWINNINKELLTSELRKTKEGNLFIVNLLKKIDQVLGEE